MDAACTGCACHHKLCIGRGFRARGRTTALRCGTLNVEHGYAVERFVDTVNLVVVRLRHQLVHLPIGPRHSSVVVQRLVKGHARRISLIAVHPIGRIVRRLPCRYTLAVSSSRCCKHLCSTGHGVIESKASRVV